MLNGIKLTLHAPSHVSIGSPHAALMRKYHVPKAKKSCLLCDMWHALIGHIKSHDVHSILGSVRIFAIILVTICGVFPLVCKIGLG